MFLYLLLSALSYAQTKPIPTSSPTPLPSVLPTAIPSAVPVLKELKDIKVKVEFITDEKVTEWKESEVELKMDESGNQPGFKIDLTGTVRNPGNSYLTEKPSKPLKVSSSQQVQTSVLIQSEKTDFSIMEIAEDGKLAKGTYRATVSDWPAAEAILKSNGQIKPWAFAAGLGVTTINFSQTNTDFSTLNSLTTTFKITVDRRLGQKGIVAGFSGFFNVLPLSGTAIGNNAFRFFGLNLKIGKMLKTLPEPWELGIHVGYYYLTMLTNGTLGFNNVSGPELYPTISRKFNNGSQALVYFKFSPISQSFSLLSLSNNEIAAGAIYRFVKKTKIQWLAGFDFASVNLTAVDTLSNTTTISTNNITLWGGVGF